MEELHSGVIHIGYYTADLDATLHFYCDILGFELTRQGMVPEDEPEDSPRYPLRGKPFMTNLTDKKSGMVLEFFSPMPGREPPVDNANRIGCSHICLGVKDLQATVEVLRKEGVRIDSAPEPGQRGPAWIRDPDGNRIELMPERR